MLLSLAPNIARAPGQLPLVTPACVYAAGRKSFEVMVGGGAFAAEEAKARVFAALPLEESGWKFTTARISRIGIYSGGTRWRLERMAEAFFIHQLGTLRPMDDYAKGAMHGLENGEAVRVKIIRPRNVKHHRLFWALMAKVHENLPDDKRERYPTTEILTAWFKVKTGHCDTFHIEDGAVERIVHIPKSISFAKMDQVEFNRFFDVCCQLIALHFIPDVAPQTWRAEVERMIGIAA